MASIQQRGERKFKITVCNGYRANGQKRMQSRTIDVPGTVPKRGIMQYVHAQAEQLEKRFRYGIDQDERTPFEQYAAAWLARQKHYKPSTLAGYARQLEVVYPFIGGIPLARLRPLNLEELCGHLRARKTKTGQPVCEATVQKYLDTVSAVLEDAKRNDIIPYNPAHRVSKPHIEPKPQRIPSEYEMHRLLQCILQEEMTYRVFYLIAISTGLRRGEICALRWNSLHAGGCLRVERSRGMVLGQGIVESSTKNHRSRDVVLPQLVADYLGDLMAGQARDGLCFAPDDLIFRTKSGPIHPDSFTRHLRRIYQKNGFPPEYHLHSLRHFFATYLLENNLSKQVAADLLGHADTAFLERTYCHPRSEAKQRAAGILNDLLAPEDEEAWEREQAEVKRQEAERQGREKKPQGRKAG